MKISNLYLKVILVVAIMFMFTPFIGQADTCSPACPAPGSGKTGVDEFSQQCAQCTSCPDPVQTCPTYYYGTGQDKDKIFGPISRYEIDYLGSSVNGNEVTFSYKVTNLGSGYAYPGLSHFVLGLGQITCLADGVSINDIVKKCYIGTSEVPCYIGTPSNPDPTTQLYGVKIDTGGYSSPYYLSFTFDQSKLAPNWYLDEGCVTMVTKAGDEDIRPNKGIETPGYACTLGPVCKQIYIPPQSVLNIIKFYDANANGNQDADEQEITGWQVYYKPSLAEYETCAYTPVEINVDPGDYKIRESLPLEPNWMATTLTEQTVTVLQNETKVVKFGNLCLGAGGGRTLGFWSNKNGQAVMNDGGTMEPELALLSSYNLKNGSGIDFDPQIYSSFRSWLLGANATNMAYMLSAQLAAMILNVEANFVEGNALVYAPGCGNTGINSDFITINDLISKANESLGSYPLTLSGHPARAEQECLKNALDWANNNKNFVQPEPCSFSFATACPVE